MHLRFVVALIAGALSLGQAAPEPKPFPMLEDRAADSYEIYSLLLEQGLKNSNWTPKYWLVEEMTAAGEPSTMPCKAEDVSETPQGTVWTNPPQNATPLQLARMGNNPHYAKPPAGHELEFRAVLDDFDSHCRERVILSADHFHTSIPIHLADGATKERFEASQNSATRPDPRTAEFDGVAGLATFSEVFFNPQHTLALVHQGNWCGTLCGTRGWVILEHKDGQWKQRGGYGWSIS